LEFQKEDFASAWLTSARLARKSNFRHQSFTAAMHASQLGSEAAQIEHSRLLWSEGHHRKAIQSLEGAIAAKAFQSYNHAAVEVSASTFGEQQELQQNFLAARVSSFLCCCDRHKLKVTGASSHGEVARLCRTDAVHEDQFHVSRCC
jgi:serine/threonine-protein kinase ATR